MGKKIYINPLTEVKNVNTAVMQVFGPASMPNDSFKNAPSRKVPALGNDSVQVF